MKIFRIPLLCFVPVLLLVLVAGCATQRIDWSARVGSYTFDQAIAEFGPPDKQAKLTDGSLVAEWLTRRGYHQVYAGGFYGAGGFHGSAFCPGPYPPQYLDSYSPDYFLRLTFGPDGRLKSWKRFAR